MPLSWERKPANQLLSGLACEEYDALARNLRFETLKLGDVIHEPGERPKYVYFLTTAVVSLLYTTENGATAEVGIIGNDGVVGIPLLLGGDTTLTQAVVHFEGEALMMSADALRHEFSRCAQLQRLLLRYTQAFLTQVSQTAVCNRLHSIEKRLCRRLLLCHDRIQSDELLMTQEFISNMLGGRRESVTVAAGRLQDAGLIRYSRGQIRIVDREGLEAAACECYRVVKEECERLLGNDRRPAQRAGLPRILRTPQFTSG